MVTSRQIRAAAIALLNVAEIYDTAERGATAAPRGQVSNVRIGDEKR